MSRKPKKIRFKLTVEAQEMVVDYQPHWLKDVGHFEFRPTRSRRGSLWAMTRVLGEVDRIARRGRNFGFRLISITQRPAKLNKDVLTQLSTLIALGRHQPARPRRDQGMG
jgi:hypothetical protein